MVSVKINQATMTGIRLLSKLGVEYGNGTLSSVIAGLVHKEIKQKGLAIYCHNGYFGEGCIVEDTGGRIKDNLIGHNKYVVTMVSKDKAHLIAMLKEPDKKGQLLTKYYWEINDLNDVLALAMTGQLKENGTPLTLEDM